MMFESLVRVHEYKLWKVTTMFGQLHLRFLKAYIRTSYIYALLCLHVNLYVWKVECNWARDQFESFCACFTNLTYCDFEFRKIYQFMGFTFVQGGIDTENLINFDTYRFYTL